MHPDTEVGRVGADRQHLQTLGEVGASEEFDGIPVFVAAFASMHLPQIGGVLRLLVATRRHIGMGG